MSMIVSIITISYNCKDTISKTIESVLSQNYQEIEYIVVDGASHDGTLDVIRYYTKKYPHRIKFISEPDEGISHAFNKGLNLASGDWVYFLNVGDYFYNHDSISKLSFLFSEYEVVTAKVKCLMTGRVWPANPLRAFYRAIPAHQATFINLSYAKQISFDNSILIRMDLDYFLRLMKKFPRLKVASHNSIVAFYEPGRSATTTFVAKLKYAVDGLRVGWANRSFWPAWEIIQGFFKIVFRNIVGYSQNKSIFHKNIDKK